MGIDSSINAYEYMPIVLESLGEFRQVSSPTAMKTMESLESGKFETAFPLATYSIDLEDFLEDDYLSKARIDGIQYFMLDKKKVFAAVELRLTGDERKASLSGIIRGKAVDGTVTGIAHAEKLPQTLKNDYDLRVLEVPGINFSALWLHSDDEKIDDMFIRKVATPAERSRKPFLTIREVKAIFGEQAKANLLFFKTSNPCPEVTAPADCG